MNKGILILLAVLILGGGAFVLLKSRPAPASSTTSAPTTNSNAPIKEFTVDGSSFAFNPSTIAVNKGDTVKINFIDSDGRHDLVIDEYNVKTDIINQGSRASLQFVADRVGSFEYYCSVGTHRDQGMKGTLTVK